MNFGETLFSSLHHAKVVRIERSLVYCIVCDLIDLMMHGSMTDLCNVALAQNNTFLCIVRPQDFAAQVPHLISL